MAVFKDADKALFPLKNISSVIQLYKNHLEGKSEPDLALLSIIAGAIENSLTCRSSAGSLQIIEPVDQSSLPVLELHMIESLYAKFHAIMASALDYPNNNTTTTNKTTGKTTTTTNNTSPYATRELVKRVSDVVWNSLTRSYYKDRAHLQSLYSYLTGSKLDCFGVAFAVVAGCQALGYSDVHLALSEDHAWVVFGESQTETAEVTWHGKGNEDKRGQEVNKGVSSRSWLYVNNKPVICTRAMEVAALVSAINPSLNATHDACEVALLQQELLWLLYDLGHLARYPMAIGNLGDLEEMATTPGRVPCKSLFQEAILSARSYYNNQHVYPYTYQGGYFYRNKMYKEAFESWANASDVIRMYNYSRDDEEIYKEFLEIANELIPYIMKVESSGFSASTILKKPGCFAHLLRFYDGICQWEEGSATPVLHIGWAKPLVNTISKFDADVRAQVHIVCETTESSDHNTSDNHHHHHHHHHTVNSGNTVSSSLRHHKQHQQDNGGVTQAVLRHKQPSVLRASNNGGGVVTAAVTTTTTTTVGSNNNNYTAVSGGGGGGSELKENNDGGLHPSIEALTAGCSEKILNPEYLLQGGGSPFVGGEETTSSPANNKQTDKPNTTIKQPGTSHTQPPTLDKQSTNPPNITSLPPNKTLQPNITSPPPTITSQPTITPPTIQPEPTVPPITTTTDTVPPPFDPDNPAPTYRHTVILHSEKMKQLKDLLLAEKLNTHAISLHLTAQSQVQVGKKGRNSSLNQHDGGGGGGGGGNVTSTYNTGGGGGGNVTVEIGGNVTSGGGVGLGQGGGRDSGGSQRPKRTRRE